MRLDRKTVAKSRAKATSPAKKARVPRVLVSECSTDHLGRGGLCKLCGWEGHRVPAPWVEEPPGTAYAEASKLIGKTVKLRDGSDVEVVSVATPLGPSLLQTGRRSKRYQCQTALIVRSKIGRAVIDTPVLRSKITERMRKREGLCPDAQVFSSVDRAAGYARMLERESAKKKVHPFDLVAELPYPHRKGGSACCLNSPLHPDKLLKAIEAWRESGEESDFAVAQAAVRKALPRDRRATMTLETAAQLSVGVKAEKDHCWSQWMTVDERAQETRREYRARQKEAREERERLGLKSVAGFRARATAAGVGVEALAASAARRSRAQFGDVLDAVADLDSNFEVV